MRTVKNRKRKFALGMKIAAMFSCIAIASVGFAAWIIVNDPANVTVEGGKITAETVSETGVTFGSITAPTENINFGTTTIPTGNPAQWPTVPGSDLSGNYTNHNWLVADSIGEEFMQAYFTVPYTPSNVTSATFKLNINAYYGNELSDANAKLKTLIDKKYINLALTVRKTGGELIESGNFTVSSTDYEVEFTLTGADLNANQFVVYIDFTWGEAFKYHNPYVYFNGHAMTPEYKLAAKTALSDLYAVVNNVASSNIEDTNENDDLNYKVLIRAEFPTPAV